MDAGGEKIYPNCTVVTRVVEVGGLSKSQLLEDLSKHSIHMNESGERLFADDRFVPSDTKYALRTVELTVGNLGFPDGANLSKIFARASEFGLELCPLELGPYLRLSYLDQPEGSIGVPPRLHQAPFGSITIASETLSESNDAPKGFYLRRIDGALWLRGYHASNLHVWNSDDHFIFCKSKEPLRK